jgi:trigger factor
MGSPVKTTVEELADSKVRLEIEVPEAAVSHALEHAASDLGESMRIPGFRKGKAPLRVVAARVGREALWAEAVRTHIDGWFWDAAQSSGVRPVSGPEVEWDDPPGPGGAFSFVATVAVAPKPVLGDWTTLEVPKAEPDVPAEAIDAELERLREGAAALVPVPDRPVAAGDTVVLDLTAREEGKQPSEHRDYVAELGTGNLAEEIEEALPGMREGETTTVELTLEGEASGTVDVTVNEIKEKVLPELDDELARTTSEFETLAELRSDIEARLREQLEAETEAQFRQDAVDALVEASTLEGIEPLVERRANALLAGFVRSLEQRGVRPETYLTMTGQTPEALQQGMRGEAERAVKRELVLEAVAVEKEIEIDDAEVEELIRTEAEQAGEDPEQTIEAMRERGGFEQLRGDLRLRRALDELVARVKPIAVELAQARERLWTPEKEKGGPAMKIWTPGSEERA